MGEGLINNIKDTFALPETDLRSYSPLTFAYIGDSIYALLAKSVIVGRGNCPAGRLHKDTVRYVSAVAQSKIYEYMLESGMLTEEEQDILRRGRNAKSHHSAKNASIEDYKMATAVEALFGWLYLKGDNDRMLELMKAGIGYLDEKE